VIELLLARGMHPAVQDANGQTGLHWAAVGRQVDTIKLLLRHNASLDALVEAGAQLPEGYSAARFLGST
jgi:ankyrin repeat protein